jgi:hypothetical protein
MVNKGEKKMHFPRPQQSRSRSQDYHGHHESVNAAGKPVIAEESVMLLPAKKTACLMYS